MRGGSVDRDLRVSPYPQQFATNSEWAALPVSSRRGDFDSLPENDGPRRFEAAYASRNVNGAGVRAEGAVQRVRLQGSLGRKPSKSKSEGWILVSHDADAPRRITPIAPHPSLTVFRAGDIVRVEGDVVMNGGAPVCELASISLLTPAR